MTDVADDDRDHEAPGAPSMRRLLARLFWTHDEDGVLVHRLEDEWNGNNAPRFVTGDYHSEYDQWELGAGVTWSHWALGPDVEVHRWAAYDRERQQSVPYRRVSVMLTLGPWYVVWTRTHEVPAAPLMVAA